MSDPKGGLVLDLKLDSMSADGKVPDASASTNHGVVAGTPVVVADPTLGDCLSFSGGGSSVTVADPFRNPKAFTISLWLKPASVGDGDWHGIIGKEGDAARKPSLWMTPSGGGLHYDSYDPFLGERFTGAVENVFTNGGEWVHVAWVKAGSTYQFYRNGTPFASRPAPAQFFTAPSSYVIGSIDSSWTGLLARVRIYDRDLSAEEVSQIVADDRGAGMNRRDPGPAYQAMEPLTSAHVLAWKTTTSGMEDYAQWRLTLQDQRLEGDPPFRRGRIWA